MIIISLILLICNTFGINFFKKEQNLVMEIMSFDVENENFSLCIAKTLEKYLISPAKSVILLFVGSDSNIGDSLAPICGSLFECDACGVFAYGSLLSPITAREVPFAVEFIKSAHPDSLIVVVDAAIGKAVTWDWLRFKKAGSSRVLG